MPLAILRIFYILFWLGVYWLFLCVAGWCKKLLPRYITIVKEVQKSMLTGLLSSSRVADVYVNTQGFDLGARCDAVKLNWQ